ncbi:MAG: sigma-70 family RNA polymerase sigma factor [Acidimicrobiaceae bacterium]|nr:sigma-70 family RNA polymerase sigma factor [Acidimicrobiaceae bacterium]
MIRAKRSQDSFGTSKPVDVVSEFRDHPELLDAFVAEIHPQLVRYLRAWSVNDAEDVAQETWIGFARALNTFEGEFSGLKPLVFFIARRRVIDELRKSSRRPQTRELKDEPSLEFDATARAIEDVLSLDSALSLIRMLPGVQAEIVALRVIADLSPSQVAQHIGRSEGYVRVNYFRAISKLVELSGANWPTGSDPKQDRKKSFSERNKTYGLGDLEGIQA